MARQAEFTGKLAFSAQTFLWSRNLFRSNTIPWNLSRKGRLRMKSKFVGVSMRRSLLVIPIACCAFGLSAQSQGQENNSLGHFMFAWTGDRDKKAMTFSR